MIVKEFSLGNTKIEVDNTYLVKTEEEKQNVYKQFNRIACEILYERKWWKMSREQKIYCKIGQAVCNVVGATLFVAVPMIACNLAGYISNLF